MITLSLCSIAFRHQPIEELVPRIAALGFDAVEIFGGQIEGKSDDELRSLKDLADRNHLQILALAPYFSFTRDQAAYNESVERAQKLVRFSRLLGAPKMRTFIDVGPTGVASAAATPEQWRQGIKGLQTITALDRTISFVIETHPLTLADTIASTERVMTEANSPNLKVLFQASTFITEGVFKAFDALWPHIDHLHLHNHNPRNHSSWIEEGEIDHPALFKRLQESGYHGSASLEYCGQGVTWEKVQSAYNYIRKYLPQKGN
jgi:3-dehydroshikimate dehydratase